MSHHGEIRRINAPISIPTRCWSARRTRVFVMTTNLVLCAKHVNAKRQSEICAAAPRFFYVCSDETLEATPDTLAEQREPHRDGSRH